MGTLRRVDGMVVEIKKMRVSNKTQGQGIGAMILDKLIQRAKELGYNKLILDTSEKQMACQTAL